MSQFLRRSAENDACRSLAWCRTVDTRARARSDEQSITPCSTLKANPPASGLDRLCYKNGPFVSSGLILHGLSAGPRRGGAGLFNPRAGCFPHGLTTVATDAGDPTAIPSQIIKMNQ
jgi:hypothetical protein